MNRPVIIVTGGGSGIGQAIALASARAEFFVVVADIVEEAASGVLDDIKRLGGQGISVTADVSEVGQVHEMFDRVVKETGRLDVLVNNAGNPGKFSFIANMKDETWHKTISVHLNGTFYCVRDAAKLMMVARSGSIINIASIVGIQSTVGSGEYGAAKAAVINLTKTAAKELGPYGITVNAIAPGMVATETNKKLEQSGSGFITTAVNGTPTGRMTNPDEIAALVLFLSSKQAGNINGQVVTIDGGITLTGASDSFLQAFLMKKSRQPKGVVV